MNFTMSAVTFEVCSPAEAAQGSGLTSLAAAELGKSAQTVWAPGPWPVYSWTIWITAAPLGPNVEV